MTQNRARPRGALEREPPTCGIARGHRRARSQEHALVRVVPAAARHVPGPAHDPAAHGEPPRRRPALGRGPARARRERVRRAREHSREHRAVELVVDDRFDPCDRTGRVDSVAERALGDRPAFGALVALGDASEGSDAAQIRVGAAAHLERDAHARRDLRRDRGRDDHRAVQVLRQRYPAPFRTVQVLRWRALDNAGTRATPTARARARARSATSRRLLPRARLTPAPHSTDMV